MTPLYTNSQIFKSGTVRVYMTLLLVFLTKSSVSIFSGPLEFEVTK